MDSATMEKAYIGFKKLVGHAEYEAHEIADALGFLAQSVEDMNHNDRGWSVGALVGFLRALEKQARDLGEYMDEEGTARSPKPTAEESALHEKQVAASQVWGDGMRAIYQHPELAGEVADALKTILDKVPAEGAGRGCPAAAATTPPPRTVTVLNTFTAASMSAMVILELMSVPPGVPQ